MLSGEYFHSFDPKGRMNFPAKMRNELGESFIVTLWSDSCLAVFSNEEWNKLCGRIRNLPMAQATKIQRFIFPNACEVVPDKQGRILLPQNLRDGAGLKKDVAVIGVMDRAEIWDLDKWTENKKAQSASSFEQYLEEFGI